MAFLEYLARIGLIQFAAAQMAWFTLGYVAYRIAISIGLIKRGAFTRFMDEMAAGDIEQQRHEREDNFLYPGEIMMAAGLLIMVLGMIAWILFDNWPVYR